MSGVDVPTEAVVEALLDELREAHRRIAYQKAALQQLSATVETQQAALDQALRPAPLVPGVPLPHPPSQEE
jgi:multidrug resistance efflux pump